MNCNFTFDHYNEILKTGIENNYKFFTCRQYIETTSKKDNYICVIRHDVDLSPHRAAKFAEIEHSHGIRATYFFRVFANEYNLFSFEVLSLIKDLKKMGHEIGYHAEPIDVSKATGLDPDKAFKIGLEAIRLIEPDVVGIASHNDPTPDNNLDYFKKHSASSLGCLYEAYDTNKLNLFNNSVYITDSYEWYWRTFINGVLTDNKECICNHFKRRTTPLYLLTHPHNWYEKHYHRVNY